eukprot:scaffold134476_cov37-Prasinocladus_malaysianus.AAC.1
MICVLLEDHNNRPAVGDSFGGSINDLEGRHLMVIDACNTNTPGMDVKDLGVFTDDTAVSSPIYESSLSILQAAVVGDNVGNIGLELIGGDTHFCVSSSRGTMFYRRHYRSCCFDLVPCPVSFAKRSFKGGHQLLRSSQKPA